MIIAPGDIAKAAKFEMKLIRLSERYGLDSGVRLRRLHRRVMWIKALEARIEAQA